jgi:hypothetical protein
MGEGDTFAEQVPFTRTATVRRPVTQPTLLIWGRDDDLQRPWNPAAHVYDRTDSPISPPPHDPAHDTWMLRDFVHPDSQGWQVLSEAVSSLTLVRLKQVDRRR